MMIKGMFRALTQVLVIFLISFISTAQSTKETLFINKINVPKKEVIKEDEVKFHLVDIIIDNKKYDLSLNSRKEESQSFGDKKYKESLFDFELVRTSKDIVLNTKLNDKDETSTLPLKSKRKDVLVELRMLTYKVILTKEEFLDQEASLRKNSITRVSQILAAERAKERARLRAIAKRKREKELRELRRKQRMLKPRTIVKRKKVLKPKIVKVRKKRVLKRKLKKKPIKVSKDNLKNIKLKGQKEKVKSKSWNWPKLYFSAGLIYGQKVNDYMPDSQGKPLLEFGGGIHIVTYKLKLYVTMSSLSEFDGVEKTATQSNFNLFVAKDIMSFSSAPFGLENILDNTKAPASLGLLAGYGESSFAGKIVPKSAAAAGVSLGAYYSALGIINFEGRYFHSISEVSKGISSSGEFSSFIVKFTVGYPM